MVLKNNILKKKTISTLLVMAALSGPLFSQQALSRSLDAHEHGVSTLKVAQEGNTIVMELDAPGNDIIGFEHSPKNEEQEKAVKDAFYKLANPDTIFMVSAEAGCKASSQEISFEAHGEHTGFEVSWKLECQAIEKAKTLKIKYFELFGNAEEVELEGIGNAGQSALEVEKDQTSIDLSTFIGK